MAKSSKIKDSPHILKMPIVLIIVTILIILTIIVLYLFNKFGEVSKSPAESFCTNREKTAVVCKNDTVCQCEGKVFDNPFFFANENGKCPVGCGTLKPASSEGKIGTCNLAAAMASNVPACAPNCVLQNVSGKTEKLTNECCTVTMEAACTKL